MIVQLWVCSGTIHGTRPAWCEGLQHGPSTCYRVWAESRVANTQRQREVGDPR